MSTYIAMLNWTQQGIKNVKESPTRLDSARSAFKRDGVTLKEMYMVTGRHDMIVVIDAPNDAALAKAMLAGASQGNFTSETCRAFTEEEFRTIVKGMAG
jgi:uncharacterized protein with GYD domain